MRIEIVGSWKSTYVKLICATILRTGKIIGAYIHGNGQHNIQSIALHFNLTNLDCDKDILGMSFKSLEINLIIQKNWIRCWISKLFNQLKQL